MTKEGEFDLQDRLVAILFTSVETAKKSKGR
jgi:hypothetical protein